MHDQVPALVALAVLRPGGGGEITGESAITASTLAQYAPDPVAGARVGDWFRQHGFDVGPLVGIAMSISAPASTFEEVFDTTLEISDDRGGVQLAGTPGGRELPLATLPADVAEHLHAVTFEEPAETTGGETSWP